MAFDLPRPAFLPALLGACLLALAAPVVVAPPARAALVGAPEEVATGLDAPWDVVPLPDGRTLVTERPGRVRVIQADGTLRTAPALVAADAGARKFLGMVKSPGYATNRFVYLYVSEWTSGPGSANLSANRVVRVVDDGTNLVTPVTIFDEGIRSDGNHDGGRMAFGPDGKLYVTTGDVHDKTLPQDPNSLNGKILRLEAPGNATDGQPAAGNPSRVRGCSGTSGATGTAIRRASRGTPPGGVGDRAWPQRGVLRRPAGRRGGPRRDQPHRARPQLRLAAHRRRRDPPGMCTPVVFSGKSQATTWAPGGLAFAGDGRLYAPLLAGQRLLDFGTAGATVTDRREVFGGSGGFGRLRDATVGRGALWITTSNATSSATEKVLRVPFDSAGPLQRRRPTARPHPPAGRIRRPPTRCRPRSERAWARSCAAGAGGSGQSGSPGCCGVARRPST